MENFDLVLDNAGTLVSIPSDHEHREGEVEILRHIQKELESEGRDLRGSQELNMYYLPSKDDPQVLVVEKGSKKADYHVAIDAHVDSVKHVSKDEAQDDWPERYELKYLGDKLAGLGIYDMKLAAAIQMWVLLNVDVPEGVHLTGGFTCDEETDSKGAQALIAHLRNIKRRIRIWNSSEVGPQHPSDLDRRQSLIIARPGALKVHGKITIEGTSNHGSLRDMPNAISAQRHFFNFLEHEFVPPLDQFDTRPYRAHKNPYLGQDWASEAYVESDYRYVHTAPQHSRFGYKVFLVPPESPRQDFSLEHALEIQKACMEEVMRREDWDTKRTKGYLKQDELRTSYPPYLTDPKHPLVQAMALEAQEVCHPGTQARVIGGTSNADPNLYHRFLREQMKEMSLTEAEAGVLIGTPYDGGNAHAKGEWASKRSAAMNCELYRRLIQEVVPRLMKARQ